MNRRSFAMPVFVLMAALLAPGCIVVDHDEADLTFSWDFEGLRCYEAGVVETVVEIYEDGYLVADAYVPCDASGVTLEGFEPGHYDVEIVGLDPYHYEIYAYGAHIEAYEGDNYYSARLGWAGP